MRLLTHIVLILFYLGIAYAVSFLSETLAIFIACSMLVYPFYAKDIVFKWKDKTY